MLSAIKAWHQIPATQSYESHYRNIYDMMNIEWAGSKLNFLKITIVHGGTAHFSVR